MFQRQLQHRFFHQITTWFFKPQVITTRMTSQAPSDRGIRFSTVFVFLSQENRKRKKTKTKKNPTEKIQNQ